MDILVVGSGGREHAICHFLLKSRSVNKLYCAPGNGGIGSIADCVGIGASDIDGMVAFAVCNAIDLVVVAPDDPLALGMVDALELAGVRAFGPRKDAAIIESSKVFSKKLMKKYGIPTARFETFNDIDSATAYIRANPGPIVVKADGLALGKGVVVAPDSDSAIEAARSMMLDKRFGDSGARIVIEEYMTGPEVTVLAFTDGLTILPMLSSQDHKRAYTGDLGPNTGGMGAFCPSPNYTDEIARICMDTIFRPTIDAMRKEDRLFKGVIYFGLMLTKDGPRVVEYNARFGDPEAQVVLSMLENDLTEIMDAIVDERLGDLKLIYRDGFACCVVMASGGYPDKYDTGFTIKGLENIPSDIRVFHAGTTLRDGAVITSGGRVLGVTALGESLASASARAYEGVKFINFENAYYRTDIGRKA